MIPIKGHATFHELKHCIVGRPHVAGVHDPRLEDIMHETEEDLQGLIKLLEGFGVVCHRPLVVEGSDRPPISPRDYFAVIGDKILVGKVIPGYKDILSSIDRKNIKWYLDNDVSTGNMVRCGDHVHWDVSRFVKQDVEKEIIQWLSDQGIRVSITRKGWHMDGVYSIIKPGVIVASEDFRSMEEIYKGWEVYYARQQNKVTPLKHEWGGDHEESNYDVNILSVNDSNCISTSMDTGLMRFLERHKVNTIVCDFRHKEFWDNGIHCVTQDLYREGQLETYM